MTGKVAVITGGPQGAALDRFGRIAIQHRRDPALDALERTGQTRPTRCTLRFGVIKNTVIPPAIVPAADPTQRRIFGRAPKLGAGSPSRPASAARSPRRPSARGRSASGR
jgi:hypothetical protein